MVAVAQREVGRFIDGLAARAWRADDLDAAMVETFVYSVEFLRDHELLQRVLRAEPESITGRVLQGGSPIVGGAVQAGAGYLCALGDLRPAEAVTVAEVLVRLVATITLTPVGALDLHDPEQLRRFAATVVPGVIAAAPRTSSPPCPTEEPHDRHPPSDRSGHASDLDPADAQRVADLLAQTQTRQSKALDDAIDGGMRNIPRLLRGPHQGRPVPMTGALTIETETALAKLARVLEVGDKSEVDFLAPLPVDQIFY